MLGQADACVWTDKRSLWAYSRLAENGVLQEETFETFWIDVISAIFTMSDEARRSFFSEKNQNALSMDAEFLSRDVAHEYESCVSIMLQQLTDIEKNLAATEKRLAATEKRLAATEKKLSKQMAEYRAISESHSWRLTKPLREIKKTLKPKTVLNNE